MYELLFALAIGLLYVGGCVAYWLFQILRSFVRWLARSIQEEIRHRRVLAEERRKERELLAIHQKTRQAIAQTAARYDTLHARETAKADCSPGRRQSGQKTE
jgi:hypothetical protein